MRRRRPGGPTEFARRRERAAELASTPGVEQPLGVLVALLAHQQGRVGDATVMAAAALIAVGMDDRAATNTVPFLDVVAAVDAVGAGIPPAVDALSNAVVLPEPLRAAANVLESSSLRTEAVRSWLTAPPTVEASLGFWIAASAQPVLELAVLDAPTPDPRHRTVDACPRCGGPPQVSVIAEESGEFMGGAPRSLICGRCAGRWPFPRATCVVCGEDDSRRLSGWTADAWPVIRIDACDTCRTYIKTFDLRRPGGRDVVPLVDDVASASIDLWATGQGLHRPVRSLAGV